MAVAHGANNNSGVVASVNTASTPSITVSGKNTLGIMGCFVRDSASTSDIDVSSATWNGVGMTSILHREYPNTAYLGVDLYYIVNPGTGVVTVNWAGTIDTGGMFGVYFTDAAQSSPVDVSNGANDNAANNTDPTVNLTTGFANGAIIDVWYNKSGSNLTIGANQNNITQLGVNAGGDRGGGSYKLTTTPGAYTMTWAASPDDDWVHIAVAIKSATINNQSIKVIQAVNRSNAY